MSMHKVLIMTASRSDLGAWWCNVTMYLYVLRLSSAKALDTFLLDGFNCAVMVTVSTCDAIDAKPTAVTKRKCNCSKMIYFSSLY